MKIKQKYIRQLPTICRFSRGGLALAPFFVLKKNDPSSHLEQMPHHQAAPGVPRAFGIEQDENWETHGGFLELNLKKTRSDIAQTNIYIYMYTEITIVSFPGLFWHGLWQNDFLVWHQVIPRQGSNLAFGPCLPQTLHLSVVFGWHDWIVHHNRPLSQGSQNKTHTQELCLCEIKDKFEKHLVANIANLVHLHGRFKSSQMITSHWLESTDL